MRFVSENFLIENGTFADPKSSQAKKLHNEEVPKVHRRAKENLSNTFKFMGRLLLREAKDRPCQIQEENQERLHIQRTSLFYPARSPWVSQAHGAHAQARPNQSKGSVHSRERLTTDQVFILVE